MATKVNNKKKIRIIVEDLEIEFTAPVRRIQQITNILYDIGASAICTGSFKLSKQQYADFASNSTLILYR